MKRTLRSLITSTAAAVLALGVTPAEAATCSNGTNTWDTEHVLDLYFADHACWLEHDHAIVDNFDVYGFRSSYWDDGFGAPNPCNENRWAEDIPLLRTLTAIMLLEKTFDSSLTDSFTQTAKRRLAQAPSWLYYLRSECPPGSIWDTGNEGLGCMVGSGFVPMVTSRRPLAVGGEARHETWQEFRNEDDLKFKCELSDGDASYRPWSGFKVSQDFVSHHIVSRAALLYHEARHRNGGWGKLWHFHPDNGVDGSWGDGGGYRAQAEFHIGYALFANNFSNSTMRAWAKNRADAALRDRFQSTPPAHVRNYWNLSSVL